MSPPNSNHHLTTEVARLRLRLRLHRNEYDISRTPKEPTRSGVPSIKYQLQALQPQQQISPGHSNERLRTQPSRRLAQAPSTSPTHPRSLPPWASVHLHRSQHPTFSTLQRASTPASEASTVPSTTTRQPT